MTQINYRWPVWVIASLQNYFLTNLTPYQLIFEGVQMQEKADWIVMAIDGPHFRPTQGKYEVSVGLFFSCNATQRTTDLYACQKMFGRIGEILKPQLDVNKCGHNDDDASSFFCLHLESEGIKTNYLGVVNEYHTGTVTARYRGYINAATSTT